MTYRHGRPDTTCVILLPAPTVADFGSSLGPAIVDSPVCFIKANSPRQSCMEQGPVSNVKLTGIVALTASLNARDAGTL